MYAIVKSTRFERSLRKIKKSGMYSEGVRSRLAGALDALVRDVPLPPIHMDHQLHGDMQECRECHIKGDLVLVYQKYHEVQKIVLHDIGTHSQIFGH